MVVTLSTHPRSGISEARYSLRAREEVVDMARHLAAFFLNSDEVVSGIYELLMNAVEHGNLGIGYALKTELLATHTMVEEVARRMHDPYLARHSVRIHVRMEGAECMLSITDEGNGFDWHAYMGRSADAAHGRGLLIAFQAGFTSVEYNQRGNVVVCRGHATRAR